ncbi:gag-pol polyprotein [Cucumis melo var. makuwa]|uniref:Gag-pol polyprotein n=1 Tax=Cucumis melo var. makuwa TaxID=1194695 RepID=A0A5A7TBK2_CUCMM|nr:gag-pol polyprotein [Cucumis melo var. makuwa]
MSNVKDETVGQLEVRHHEEKAVYSPPNVGNIGGTGLPKYRVLFSSAIPQAVTKSELQDHRDNQRGTISFTPFNGRAWRALVAGYDPPMSTVDGVSVPKPEVEWIDAE